MPIGWGGWSFARREATCQRRVTWSTMRGGCRFAPGHQGPCKPLSRSVRGYRPPAPTGRTLARTAG